MRDSLPSSMGPLTRAAWEAVLDDSERLAAIESAVRSVLSGYDMMQQQDTPQDTLTVHRIGLDEAIEDSRNALEASHGREPLPLAKKPPREKT
jgi:hypothetical protein